jgi:hypothetical protein
MAGRSPRKLPPSYWCSSYNGKGRAACAPNRISEARFLAAPAAKLKERFNPAFLESFAEAVRREMEEAKAGRGVEAAELRTRLAALDEEMKQHGQRILRVPEALLESVQAAALETQHQREAVARQLAAVEATPQEKGQDPAEMIAKAKQALERLEAVLAKGDPAEVRSFFRDNLERIEVYFNPPQERGNQNERFSRALVYVRDDSPLVFLLYGEASNPVANRKS